MIFKENFYLGRSKNDFNVIVEDHKWEGWKNIIISQTVGIEINLVTKKINLFIRELKKGTIQDIIFFLLSGEHLERLLVQSLKPKKDDHNYVFVMGKLVDHHTEFSLYGKDPVVHRLTLKFEKVFLSTQK